MINQSKQTRPIAMVKMYLTIIFIVYLINIGCVLFSYADTIVAWINLSLAMVIISISAYKGINSISVNFDRTVWLTIFVFAFGLHILLVSYHEESLKLDMMFAISRWIIVGGLWQLYLAIKKQEEYE